jgi:hypothetical protein
MRKMKKHIHCHNGVTLVYSGRTMPLNDGLDRSPTDAVRYMFGISRTTLWKMKQRGEFPASDPVSESDTTNDQAD